MQLYSHEAEKAVLGTFLLDNAYLSKSSLNTEDFTDGEHRIIFEKINQTVNKNITADILTIGHDNIFLLNEMMERVITTANFRNYHDIVKDKSLRRKLYYAGENICKLAQQEFESTEELHSKTLSQINVFDNTSKNEPVHISEIINKKLAELEELNSGGVAKKKSWGYEWLDRMTGGICENYAVLGARPSVGKTTLAFNISLRVAKQNIKVMSFNLEMSNEKLLDKLIGIETGLEMYKLSAPWTLSEKDWEKVGQSTRMSNTNMVFVDDTYTIEEICIKAKQEHQKGALKFIIIDHMHLIRTAKKCNSENDKFTYISNNLAMLKKELKCQLLVLAQLNRTSDKEKREPRLTDLRECGAIEQDADTVFFLHDPNYNDYEKETDGEHEELSLIIAKQRYGQRDVKKTLKFYKKTQRIFDN